MDHVWIEDRRLLESFLGALRAEHEALIAGQAEALTELADRKLDCARQLERDASPGLGEMLRATRALQKRGETAASEEDGALFQLVREAAELNRINGVLIDQHLGQVRLSLSRIEPVSPTRQLYGRDGQGQLGRIGRSFGAA